MFEPIFLPNPNPFAMINLICMLGINSVTFNSRLNVFLYLPSAGSFFCFRLIVLRYICDRCRGCKCQENIRKKNNFAPFSWRTTTYGSGHFRFTVVLSYELEKNKSQVLSFFLPHFLCQIEE